APTISVANPESAQFPARKLTEIGGQFPAWSDDAKKVHWSIGNAHFVYDLDAATAFADSVKAAKKAEEEKKKADEEKKEEGDSDSDDSDSDDESKDDKDKEKKAETYEPLEIRVKIPFTVDIPQGSIVLKGARIITMNGDNVIESGDIYIVNNRIRAVGASGSVTVSAGTKEMDVRVKTIIPAPTDVHAS